MPYNLNSSNLLWPLRILGTFPPKLSSQVHGHQRCLESLASWLFVVILSSIHTPCWPQLQNSPHKTCVRKTYSRHGVWPKESRHQNQLLYLMLLCKPNLEELRKLHACRAQLCWGAWLSPSYPWWQGLKKVQQLLHDQVSIHVHCHEDSKTL